LYSSGSLKIISRAITLAPAIARLFIALARMFLGHGKRPIAPKSSSSIATISISGFLSPEALSFLYNVCKITKAGDEHEYK